MSRADSRLFKPLKVGNLNLSNRVVLAPLTRFRADDDHVPLPFVGKYYAQRGSYPGTLLITEATFISKQGSGYANAPGIFSQAQIASWKEVVSAVHAQGSHIYLQLWHLGRAARPDELAKDGLDVVSASNKSFEGGATPRPLTEEEIRTTIQDYATAARNAVEGAGFDGVEIHGANGYLVDQFIQDNSNDRTDRWGGSIENRARFALEVAKAVVDAVGPERTGIRLSPWSTFQGMRMADPLPQFTHVIRGLAELDLAYVHVTEPRVAGSSDQENPQGSNDTFVELLRGKYTKLLVAGGFKPDNARQYVDDQHPNDDLAVVFGRYFISNPDLVFRLKNNIELTPYNRKLFYQPKQEAGYIDYPFSEEYKKEARL